jgi:hypothetical protein
MRRRLTLVGDTATAHGPLFISETKWSFTWLIVRLSRRMCWCARVLTHFQLALEPGPVADSAGGRLAGNQPFPVLAYRDLAEGRCTTARSRHVRRRGLPDHPAAQASSAGRGGGPGWHRRRPDTDEIEAIYAPRSGCSWRGGMTAALDTARAGNATRQALLECTLSSQPGRWSASSGQARRSPLLTSGRAAPATLSRPQAAPGPGRAAHALFLAQTPRPHARRPWPSTLMGASPPAWDGGRGTARPDSANAPHTVGRSARELRVDASGAKHRAQFSTSPS